MTMKRDARGPVLFAALLAMVLLDFTPAGALEEFHAFMAPETTLASVDSVFTVSFSVDSTAHEFNGYTVMLQFDRRILRFQSVAVGPRMRQACASQFTYTVLDTEDTNITINYTDVLLCADTSVDGPGDLATFTFGAAARGESPLAIVSDPNCTFFDAGECVSPSHPTRPRLVTFTDGVVFAGFTTGAVSPPAQADASSPAIEYRPNPARAGGFFRLSGVRPGPLGIEVFDSAGRRVYARTEVADGAAAREIPWGGTDGAGRPLAAGVYFARVELGTTTSTTKVVIAR